MALSGDIRLHDALRGPVLEGIGPRSLNAARMDRPDSSPPPAQVSAQRADGLARLVLVVCVCLSVWLAVAPVQGLFEAQDRAARTSQQLRTLSAEQKGLDAQTRELSRGSGLEEQARRQGLIDPAERAYVIQGVRTP